MNMNIFNNMTDLTSTQVTKQESENIHSGFETQGR